MNSVITKSASDFSDLNCLRFQEIALLKFTGDSFWFI